ncbi:MAG TPA: DUF1015 family protein [Thermoanaerobaculia bacterium]|nr:DUF1015 family protein [Thermoanaerobaculia bacterium]
MRLFAFEGIRYTPLAGDVAELAAVPYDQIDDARRIRYHVKSPQQFVQLTRPVAAPGGNESQSAAALHRQWLDEGMVVRDERPALYPYVIRLEDGGERLGVAGLVALDDVQGQAADEPPADRVTLLEALRADLEPVFLLADDGGRLDELIREDVQRLPALVHHEDPDENLHVIYKLDDPARIALYQQALAAAPARIVGGHKVYQAARAFAATRGAQPGTAAAAKLAVVTSSRGISGVPRPGVMSGLVWADHESGVL